MSDPTLPSPGAPEKLPPPAPPFAAGAGPALVEDAGSQALSDALRSSFRIVRFLMVLLALIFVSSGVFTVNPNEVAVVLRFGRPVGTGAEQLLKPGLHWAFPYPIDEVVRVPVGQSHTVVSTIGWYATTPEEEASGLLPAATGVLRPGVDGYTLTADGNVVHARATLKYRIRPESAADHVFGFVSATNLLQDVVDHALVRVSAQSTAEGALYRDKMGFSDRVRAGIDQGITQHGLGVQIETLDVQTSAPLDVRQAFDDVLTAQQTARSAVNEAQAHARGVTNNAIAQAQSIRNDGLTYSNQVVKMLAAEATRFQEHLPDFRANPELYRSRMMADTMARVLTNAQFKIFVPARADGLPREIRLQLGREPEKPKSNEPPRP